MKALCTIFRIYPWYRCNLYPSHSEIMISLSKYVFQEILNKYFTDIFYHLFLIWIACLCKTIIRYLKVKTCVTKSIDETIFDYLLYPKKMYFLKSNIKSLSNHLWLNCGIAFFKNIYNELTTQRIAILLSWINFKLFKKPI